ncbi:DNA primase [Lentilactobacillus sp. SPB1-3]|uniref:DNA primase n=1 Tax=Lentilactobacillus terminaliae TaxID=3003483 RepID=A0ACD5DCC0_9LACO|nr:DNA primase [Lentilactobacillus sp. SPB1-3]MCZ0977271.1 DNA primase [Lentilactobacillus sp. SPB1-3]
MAMIPEEVIEQVRSQVNIVDVVSQYVQLTQSGKNLFGLCPFHEERTPSFSVSEDKQIFHCFSCGRGGNVFKFLMELENLTFPEAVRKVADLQNIHLDEKYASDGNQQAKRENSVAFQLMDIHEQAVTLYHHILVNTELGRPALDYLKKRGLTDDTIEKYHLGFAPGQRLLKPFFDEKKTDFQLLRKSGLFSENDSGDLYDRFVDRVMFPIRNENGKTVAFSGRLLNKQPDLPKYLNSPETEIFNKRKVLFNLDSARLSIRKNDPAILLEGFMDVISADQAGIHSGIASMGTSLTDEQVYDISRITNEVVISYDGDTPGQKAIKRAIDSFANNSKVAVKIVTVPDNLDPDEFIRQRGTDQFMELVKHAASPIDFELNYLKKQYNLESEVDSGNYISEALTVIAKESSPITRDLYLNKVASEFNVSKELLSSRLETLAASNQRQQSHNDSSYQPNVAVAPINQPAQVSQKWNLVQFAEARLLNRMLHDHDIWLKVQGIENFAFVDEEFQMLYLLSEGYFTKFDEYNVATMSSFITENALQSLLVEIDSLDLAGESTDSEIDDYVNLIINRAPVIDKIASKRQELQEAVTIGDVQRQRQLTIEIVQLEQKKQAGKHV